MDQNLLKSINSTFSNDLIYWYSENKRDLPWRETTDPYKIWLSEIILQQTQVKQGLPYYLRFIKNFPNVEALSSVSENDILKMWEGLGYYSRARNLYKTATIVTRDLNGSFPVKYSELIKLPGIGDYSASAISSFSSNEVVSVVDGNVYRFISRLLGISTPINTAKSLKEFKKVTMKLISKNNPSDFNQAIMDFGAVICKPAVPNCYNCTFQNICYANNNDKVFDFPVKSKIKKPTNRFFNYLVFVNNSNETIIEKREKKGIWQNLYQFPLMETENIIGLTQVLEYVKTNQKITLTKNNIKLFNNETIVHKLSHQRITISFWIINVNIIKSKSVNFDNINSYPFPRPLSKFLSMFK